MMARLALHEYQTTTLRLTPEDYTELQRDLGKQLTVVPSLQRGWFDINPGPFVGVVRLPSGLTLDLLPKVPLFNVMWMIAEVERLEDINYAQLERTAQVNTFDDILEPIANAFVAMVEHLVDRGLYRTYIEVEDNLSAIRGRIDFREDLNRNVVLRHRTYCRFTEFSWDVPENQVIRQVVVKLAGWGFSSRLTGRLISLDRQMEDVHPGNLRPHDIDRFQYSRQSEHYRPIHRFCRLFLNGFSLSEQIGESPFDGFVMNMNVLFEQFVSMKLQHNLAVYRQRWHLDRQSRFALFERQSLTIRPDLLLRHNGMPVLVADTKYKRASGADGNSGDYYQMIAYCSVLKLETALLIYPRHLGEIDQQLAVRGAGMQVHEVSIDLRESRQAIEAGLATLANRMVAKGLAGISALAGA